MHEIPDLRSVIRASQRVHTCEVTAVRVLEFARQHRATTIRTTMGACIRRARFPRNHRALHRADQQKELHMANAKELRVWSLALREWADRIDDLMTSHQANLLAGELLRLAECQEVAERQFV